MALQGSGAIKYSQIQEEFGVAYPDATNVTWTETYNDYDGGYHTLYDEFSAPSGNWVELPFSWVTLYDDFSALSGNFVQFENTLTTIFDGYDGGTLSTIFDGYVEGQSYVKIFGDLSTGQLVSTVVYEGVEIGTLDTAFLTIEENGIPVRRYSGGDRVVDGGNFFQNPSYYKLKVEKIEGQSYVKALGDLNTAQIVWTVVYQGVNIGTLDGAFLTIGNKRYSGGNRVVDGGNFFQNPSFYELKVEDLVSGYVFRYNWQIVGSNADGGVLESGAFKYTRGSQIYDINKYAIKVEEYKADEVNGTYTYKYGFNDVATSTSTSVTSGTYRYSRGDVRFQGAYDDPSPKNRYVIKVENSPTTYLKIFGDVSTGELVYTAVYGGIEIGTLDGAYLTVGNKRYSGGDRVVDGGNFFQNPSYYKLIIETSDAQPSFGNYRVSEQLGSLTLPLDSDAGVNNDTDIPGPGSSIKFSNFYNARLNIAIDYYKTDTLYPAVEYRQIARDRYNLNDKTRVIGGFKERPTPSGSDSNTGGSKVIIAVDKKIGSSKLNPDIDDMTQQPKICALRTGDQWSSGTRMRIEVGDNGKIMGAGGDGGRGGSADAQGTANPGGDGGDGSGALGIEYGTDSNPTIVRVKSSGRIITGYGGGGGGAGAYERENSPDRAVSGGGGGGGAGLPAGIKGGKDQSSGSQNSEKKDGRPNERQCNASNLSFDGSEPNDGEQGGEGSQVLTTTYKSTQDMSGNIYPIGTTLLMGGDGCNSDNECISGPGGNGRDQTVDGTTGVENGEGGESYGVQGRGEWGGNYGGNAGADGGAVRRSTSSIKWKFDTDHVTNSVFGPGKNVTPTDTSESPIGVS